MSSSLSYSLGAHDISKIVDAILPKISPFLPNLVKGRPFLTKKNLTPLLRTLFQTLLKLF